MPQRILPLPLIGFSQVIMAGGDEDISPGDLIDWVHPVLAGISASKWIAAELTVAHGTVQAVCRRGCHPSTAFSIGDFSDEERIVISRSLPRPSAAVILLDDHAPQVMALLDNMACWLMVFDAGAPELRPLLCLLQRLCAAEAQTAKEEKGTAAGALLELAAE